MNEDDALFREFSALVRSGMWDSPVRHEFVHASGLWRLVCPADSAHGRTLRQGQRELVECSAWEGTCQ